MNDLDKNKRFPLQNAENRRNECVGEAISDVLGNYYEQLLDPDFSEAVGFHLQGRGGSDGGVDLKAAMLAACVFGSLPETDDPSDPTQTSEAKETDWGSYTLQQIQLAAHFAPNGIIPLYSYDQVTDYTKTYQRGAVLQLRWDTSWTGVDGQLPASKGGAFVSQHAVAAYETLALGIRIKAFDIPTYHYLSRPVFEKAFVVGYGFSFDAYKFLTIVNAILYSRNWSLIPLLSSTMVKTK